MNMPFYSLTKATEHAELDMAEAPVLTPSERVSDLIDAIALYEVRRRASNEMIAHFGDDISSAEITHIDDLIEAELGAADEVMARVRTLMGDGTLEHCSALLKTHWPN